MELNTVCGFKKICGASNGHDCFKIEHQPHPASCTGARISRSRQLCSAKPFNLDGFAVSLILNVKAGVLRLNLSSQRDVVEPAVVVVAVSEA